MYYSDGKLTTLVSLVCKRGEIGRKFIRQRKRMIVFPFFKNCLLTYTLAVCNLFQAKLLVYVELLLLTHG
jgi:hypothetical protein